MHYLTGAWESVGGTGPALDLLKTVIQYVLGWPVIALVLGLIFRKPLTDLLGRINGFKGVGLEVSATQPLASAQSDPKILPPPEALKGEIGSTNPETAITPTTPSDNAPPPPNLDAVKKFGTGIPIVDEDVATIKKQLAALSLPLNSEETGELLVRHLAATQLMVRCERTHRLIYGSQLVALHLMNNSGRPQPEESLRPIFENARAQEPKFYGAYTFENWVGFLIKEITVTKTEKGLYAITVYGQSYLNYVGLFATGPKPH
jgi:hypothetical protein